jgi:pimeloyl-ACP methyl ester carboxylesterase
VSEPREEFVAVAGDRLEVRWLGPPPERAPTLVFVHEGLGSVSTWRDFPARLAAATGCGALLYSRAGYGRSSPVPLPRPVSFMHREAVVLSALLGALRITRPLLVGHSDGASIALLQAASGDPPRPLALVLEAPHVFTEAHGLASIAHIGAAYADGELRRRLARHHADPDLAFHGWNRVWLDPAFRDWNIESALPRITAPLLLIQGTGDPYGTLDQLEAIRRGVSGRVQVLTLQGCGHAPHRERSAEVLAAAATFVQDVASGAEE